MQFGFSLPASHLERQILGGASVVWCIWKGSFCDYPFSFLFNPLPRVLCYGCATHYLLNRMLMGISYGAQCGCAYTLIKYIYFNSPCVIFLWFLTANFSSSIACSQPPLLVFFLASIHPSPLGFPTFFGKSSNKPPRYFSLVRGVARTLANGSPTSMFRLPFAHSRLAGLA